MAHKFENDENVATEVKPEKKLKKPTLYKVLLHNDNYTTREFVVAVLREIFHKSETD
ncbi:MAG TPA: ATP-dependent Clp protease adaptor ClpS, partial [Archangium sp.]|nr:ATP-dependent Clp protease adaptor ClpS [Archangium sp.]